MSSLLKFTNSVLVNKLIYRENSNKTKNKGKRNKGRKGGVSGNKILPIDDYETDRIHSDVYLSKFHNYIIFSQIL